MSHDAETRNLVDGERGYILGVLSVGGDRQMAAHAAGATVAELRHAMWHDSAFAREVRRCEALAEVAHMQNLEQAAKDTRNWRISTWWLERSAPDRFGRRPGRTITPKQLELVFEQFIAGMKEDIHDLHDRERMLDRIGGLGGFIDADALGGMRRLDANADIEAPGETEPSEKDTSAAVPMERSE